MHHRDWHDITSATMSSWDGDDDIKFAADNWTRALSHADNGMFSADTMMCFLHGIEMPLTFHEGNGDAWEFFVANATSFSGRGLLPSMLRISWMLFHPAIA